MHLSCHTYQWVMSYLSMSHVTHMMNVSCHPHECVMPPTWMRHVTCKVESCQSLLISHSTHINESCHTCEWVVYVSRVGISDRVRAKKIEEIYQSCHTYQWVMWQIWMSHVTLGIGGKCASEEEGRSPRSWSRCPAPGLNICHMTHSYVCNDSFMYVAWH